MKVYNQFSLISEIEIVTHVFFQMEIGVSGLHTPAVLQHVVEDFRSDLVSATTQRLVQVEGLAKETSKQFSFVISRIHAQEVIV
jgi:hypothetical protein